MGSNMDKRSKFIEVCNVSHYTKDSCQGKTQPMLSLQVRAQASFPDPLDAESEHPETLQQAIT